jgi:hypothetical protein
MICFDGTGHHQVLKVMGEDSAVFSLDNRLTDGGKVVSLTRRPPFTTQEDSRYSFLLEAESTSWP